MLADGRTYRLVHDHLGSIRRVVDTATGEVVQAFDFDAYGRVLRDTNPGFQPFGYAAGHYDPQTGLVRYGARDYDAAIGRWLAKDPSLIAGGDTNLYAYVDGDPIGYVDPDGRKRRLYDYIDTSHDGWLQQTSDFFAGFGDTISMGATEWVRAEFSGGDPTNTCGGAYAAGVAGGVAHSILSMFAGAGGGIRVTGGRSFRPLPFDDFAGAEVAHDALEQRMMSLTSLGTLDGESHGSHA